MPVVGGVAIPRSEPGDIPGVADEERGDDGTDPIDVGHRRLRSGHPLLDQGLVGFDVPVQAADVAQMRPRWGVSERLCKRVAFVIAKRC